MRYEKTTYPGLGRIICLKTQNRDGCIASLQFIVADTIDILFSCYTSQYFIITGVHNVIRPRRKY